MGTVGIYIHYILYSLVLILFLKCGVVWGGGGGVMFFFWGGGGCNVFLTFYAISNISRKKNLGIQTNYFSFNVFFVFFCMLEILKSAPSLIATG